MLRCLHNNYLAAALLISLIFTADGLGSAEKVTQDIFVNTMAKMACQIPLEDRYVAVFDPEVDKTELQDCIGGLLGKQAVQVLMDFQFSVVEPANMGYPLDTSAIRTIGDQVGARALLVGDVRVEQETIRVTYRMIRIETRQIIGVASCVLPKKVFGDCLVLLNLTAPTPGNGKCLPEPRRVINIP